jgi:predicted O-linked N-acetylglucosamine transferase (SPINDLY family)
MADPLEVAHGFLAEGELAQAGLWARRALALNPEEPAVNNLLGVLADAKFDAWTACRLFGRALARDPFNVLVFSNIAGTLARAGIAEAGARVARRTLALRPGHAKTLNNLAQALKGAGYIKDAVIAFRRSIASERNADIHSNLVFTLSYGDELSSVEIFEEYRRWERLHASPFYAQRPAHTNDADPDRPLIVGYLSQDFREHTIGRHLAALFENHDRSVMQPYGYTSSQSTDAVAERCRLHSAAWRRIAGQSDDAVAQLIRRDRVDILVVVAGHTANGRLLVAARKPAPIQTSVYEISTTGLCLMDYWFSDTMLHPQDGTGTTEVFTETLWRLPCFFLHPADDTAPEPGPPPVLRNGCLTFGSFNNTAKLSATTIESWAHALRAVPGSRMVIKYLAWCLDAAVQGRVLRLFHDNGIAADRILFSGPDLQRRAHFESWNTVDVALDAYPFGGCTASFEALWMGVPMISLAGTRFVSRFGLTVLNRLGMDDLVASKASDFGAIAARLAGDHARLAALRSTLRDKMRTSPLCDGKAQAGYFEDAYREMWRRWCSMRPPTG